MPRVLTFEEQQVDAAMRAEYMARVAVRRAAAASAGVNFWVFEHAAESGRFVEFTEGASAEAVRAAHGESQHGNTSLALWREVRGE